MTTPAAPEAAARVRADLITAIVLIALGIGVTLFALNMDRLEVRRIQPSTIPGLVPTILGICLTLCGTLLGLRSYRLEQKGGGAALISFLLSWTTLRLGAALGLILIFTLGLVGHMPFWLASALFIFCFITLFEAVLSDEPKPLIKTLLWALVVSIGASAAVHYVFGGIFLVRLP